MIARPAGGFGARPADVGRVDVVVAAIYLRGIERPAVPAARGWPEVVAYLRREFGDAPAGDVGRDWASEIASALYARGHFIEAAALAGTALRQAEALVTRGLALSISSPHYPVSWVSRLGLAAPPALYSLGAGSLLGRPALGIVGSRHPPSQARRTAGALAAAASAAGYAIVSGGAPGVDRAAAAGAAALIELWPCGLGKHWGGPRPAELLRLSLSPPREFFATAAAMERNALIFALAEATFVAHARFKEGGAWHGAVSALRRRAGVVLIPSEEPKSWGQAWRALRGLGARPFDADRVVSSSSGAFSEALRVAIAAEPQPGLPGLAPSVGRALAAF